MNELKAQAAHKRLAFIIAKQSIKSSI